MTLATDLQTVRSILEARGRAVHYGIDPEGRVCLGNAIALATRDRTRHTAVTIALVDEMPSWYRDTFENLPDVSLVAFNDTTADDRDVFDLIDKALAEAGGL